MADLQKVTQVLTEVDTLNVGLRKVTQVLTEAETLNVGLRKVTQVLTEAETLNVGLRTVSQILVEVEWQDRHLVTGIIPLFVEDNGYLIFSVEWRFSHPTVNALVFLL